MAEQWELDEEGIRRLGALTLEQPELVESLSLQGSYAGKIHSIGDAFRNFKSLRSLDLSRNLITSLKGIQYLCSLQDLNLYYNNIPSLVEVSRLQPLPFLKELDLRLNPVVRKDTDYRLFAVYTLQTLEKLDDRAVRESERKAAKLHFSQLGNSENFLLEMEKSSREKTVKNCVTNESTASKVSTDSDNRIEPEIRRYSPHQLTIRSPEKMAKEGYRISFLDNKSSGSSPEKDLIPKPDTYQLTHDASLGKRLDVGDSSQIHPYQLPSDVGLENYDSHYSQNLSLHGSIGKRPQRNKNYREYSTKPSNNMKATTSHSCGDLLTSLSNPDSSTGRLLKLSSDDLLRKNQQLNMQVSCLNQELAQLKKLEETVTLLHESQRSLVVTNEYLLQQLNKEQKGYSGKALLPPEKSHHLGRSSPFGKSTLSSSSPVAHDMGCQRERKVERLDTYLLP
ncbi:hypothetical protein MJG53_013851 [Ovis ammon polii x Ovis aries]|uniref:Uncharacterized protein n=1 Tax=Ovis ammon polii x Ovis aries TaxID=2918886 RepID=A0ACB9UJH3_9CETA|nr:hypothetical protein MJT46_013462 [Ovis ammon polii x Ovis aries]KAI4571745.1 hypothetical protein MJG53_013851 [Ovis ammon polii x Ovis aries]